MPANRITVTLEGDARDSGHVRLNDFIRQLEAVKTALRQTERVFGHSENNSLYYRIVDLSHSSPATVVLEAVETRIDKQKPEETADAVVTDFFRALDQITKNGEFPEGFDYPAAEAYREIGGALRGHVSKIVVANTHKSVAIDRRYEEKITKAIGPDERVEGSIAGTLDTIKLHNTTAFEIFPTIGPKKVSCVFPANLKERVKAGIERYVRVYGQLRYKHWDKFPYAIDASDLEIYPPESELPSLLEIKGMAPDLTGELSTEEFLRKVRNAW
jgi:hypothetical protein